MRKIFLPVVLSAIFLALSTHSCSSGTEKDPPTNPELDSLRTLCSEQQVQLREFDEVITTVSTALDSINENRERLLSFTDIETKRRLSRNEIAANLLEFSELVARQRQRIEELESKLAAQGGQTLENMRTMIEFLQSQLNEKETEVTVLMAELNKSRKTIGQLNASIENLSMKNEALMVDNEQLTVAITTQTNTVSESYVLIADKKRLKNIGIIKGGGFLKKSATDLTALNKSDFAVVDSRTFLSVNIPSGKPKILTSMPAGSYRITKLGNENSLLEIINPGDFWSISNYLIIQTD